jgi:hypothetical protein
VTTGPEGVWAPDGSGTTAAMSHDIHIGDEVSWSWGNGTGRGTVTERFTSKVTRTIDGSEITRNASDDEPAYLIEQDDGARVLKSTTELSPAS